MSIRITGKDARDWTDAKLAEMEAYLKNIYSDAAEELEKKAKNHWADFRREDEKMKKAMESEKISPKAYKSWRKAELTRGKRFKQLKEIVTSRISDANKIALSYINRELPEVFCVNYNAMGTAITDAISDEEFRSGYSFALVDEETVRVLAAEDMTLLPQKKLNIPKDQRWNAKKLQSELLHGIIQGEDIPTIAARMQNVTDMNRDAAVRNARTMVTGAENRGRLDGMERAVENGIILEREWMDAGDRRVRDLHALLDGQRCPVDKPFEVEGYVIMYPGDPGARPEMVYNCRCTTCAVVTGFKNPATGKLVTI